MNEPADSLRPGPLLPFDVSHATPALPSTPLALVPLMRRVENAAWKLIRRCLDAECRESLCLPIPIERWVEGPLGLRLEIADLSDRSQDGLEVLGATEISSKTIRVSDRIADQENRFRFTVAHELGHITLHAHLTGTFRDSADGPFLDDLLEREANRFAAAFLVPVNALRQELPRFAAATGVTASELLDRVSIEEPAATTVLLGQVIPRLSKRFGVADTTSLGRLRDLQFDDGRPLIPHRVLRKLHTEVAGKNRRSK